MRAARRSRRSQVMGRSSDASAFVPCRGVNGAVAVAPSGLLFAVSVAPEEVHIIAIDDGRVVSVIEGGEYTESMDWSHDGTRLAIAASYQGGSRVGVALIDPDGTLRSEIDIRVSESDRHATPDCEVVCGVRFAPDDTSLIFWHTTRSDFRQCAARMARERRVQHP